MVLGFKLTTFRTRVSSHNHQTRAPALYCSSWVGVSLRGKTRETFYRMGPLTAAIMRIAFVDGLVSSSNFEFDVQQQHHQQQQQRQQQQHQKQRQQQQRRKGRRRVCRSSENSSQHLTYKSLSDAVKMQKALSFINFIALAI